MAEPFTIIGLTSNIISFIDFGLKVVSASKQVRDSLHGTTDEIRELDTIIKDVRELNREVLCYKLSGPMLSKDEEGILNMAKECERLATRLQKLLDELKMREDARSRTLESTRIAFQGYWRRKEIDDLRSRLEGLDRRVRDSVRDALQGERDSTILSQLKAIEISHQRMGINYDFKLELIRQEILPLTKHTQGKDGMDAIQNSAQLASLRTKLDVFERERTVCEKQSRVVESLYFPEIRRRWSQIPKADGCTNAWLFDRSLTSFMHWLEAQDGLYWIQGRAGSGKSTLMKFASEHETTLRTLKIWAGSSDLHTATYFFWNQGFEMQKSQVGLLQSLLYQILRRAPSLIPHVCRDHPDHEAWEIGDLKVAFQHIAEQNSVTTKFCFFIDGLDEYNGGEEEAVQILTFLSCSRHIKICASSRPRTILEAFFKDPSRMLIIHDFTKQDMKSSVRTRLQQNKKFRDLEASEPSCEEIVTVISDQAHGVWLWVFLVTRDLVHAVNRDEGLPMLMKIVHQFPPDLKAYFECIIENIRPEFREEMAQIFLITIDEVQPLPLFAFSLLEREKADPDYAVNTPICQIAKTTLSAAYGPWKSRIQNRCGDLLVVEDELHPVFLSHPVDFLHRTVREYLQDCYYQQLREELGSDFSSVVSLSKITLLLLKSLPTPDFRDKTSINRVIGLVDEFLYYAREVEVRDDSSITPLANHVDELDRVNRYFGRSLRNHWTHARDSPTARGCDEYFEGGNCNFLALAVQARLVKYVSTKLQSDPRSIQKPGRPLLDYALRPRRTTPIRMPYHSQREDSSVDVNMVRMLLENGADPNKNVHLYDSCTVWSLFLLSCYEAIQREEISPVLKNAWYLASQLLVQHGAKMNCRFYRNPPGLTVSNILDSVFGADQAATLRTAMEDYEAHRVSQNSWSLWRPWGSWFATPR